MPDPDSFTSDDKPIQAVFVLVLVLALVTFVPCCSSVQTSLHTSDTNCVKFEVPAQVDDGVKTVKGYTLNTRGAPCDQRDRWWGGRRLEAERSLT